MRLAARRLLPPLIALAATAAHVADAAEGFKVERWTHPSGVDVFFYPVGELPILDVSVILDAGNARDPEGKEGLAALTANLLSAGAGDLDENAFAERLAFTGGFIGAESDRDKMVVSLRTLSDERPKEDALELLRLMLREPAFPEDALVRERDRSIASLKQSLTEPGTIVSRNFRTLMFGDHPYGRLVTEESIGAVSREDLVAKHRESMVLSRIKFAFVGDTTREEIDRIVGRITDGLDAGEPLAPLSDPSAPEGEATRKVEHPSAQSHIIIGHLGLKRGDPDYFALHLGAEVLGGGMASRLFEEVREKRGLAYSVYSYFNPTWARGEFVMNAQTSNERRDEALQVMRETFEKFIDEGPDEAELNRAKESWRKGFALRLDSNRKIMGYVEVIAFYGLPLDYPDYARGQVAQLSADDVKDAFRRRIRPDRLLQVVVGS